ncbi:J domain-containing protein [Saccharospirillum impatiens]|uniref:J domain-containing protein n=1 Tax=Saccharospirillum impatiens TaxID=169438 RepID=UPI00048A4F24|nr:DnaJ domain-containing protein [Saccharospirillum impatiens]
MTPISLLFLFAVALTFGLALKRMSPAQRKRPLIVGLITLLVGGLLFLAATHRLYLLGVLLAALLPWARRLLPLLIRFLPSLLSRGRSGKASGATGHTSRVQSALLDMELEHDSGVMHGTVLAGPYEGKTLADLEEQEFLDLLDYCRQRDSDSARLLETYLDKRFGDRWRKDDHDTQQDNQHKDSPQNSGAMTDADAYDILGLEPGADRDAIIQAHRRLMQKAHPDRGGSDWLAARINAARSHLLED